MCEPQYRKGQQVAVAVREDRTGRGSIELVYDCLVRSVGPSWITVQADDGQRWKFDHEGGCDDYIGHPPELWPSRAAAEANIHLVERWGVLQELVREARQPPEHLNASQIDTMILTIQGRL